MGELEGRSCSPVGSEVGDSADYSQPTQSAHEFSLVFRDLRAADAAGVQAQAWAAEEDQKLEPGVWQS